MAKSFLRSGNLDDMLALGENGQPVFASALQLREALRLKQQQHIADCLAIPQPNEDGDRMDWYSPIPGKVTSWIAASHGERTRAIKQLEMCQATVAAIGQRALQAEKTGHKLFGALLSKAFQFPDQNHVYLVDGKPVITFWGFVDLDKKSRLDALDCLRATADEPKVEMTLTAAPAPIKATVPVKVPSQAAPVLPVAKAPMETNTAAVDAVKSAPNRWRRLRLWLLVPAAALAAVFALQLIGTKPTPVPAQPQQPTAQSLSKPVAVASKTVPPPVLKKSLEEADTHLALPVAKATVVAPVVAPVAAEPVSLPVAVSKDALVLPPEAVKIGSTKFLNGRWRANLDIKDPVTGRPPVLKYQIKDGKGSARITYGDNISCRVDIHAGLMQSGNLVINSRTKARCSDGSRYQIPELVCKQGLTGAADCTGRYDADTLLPITMKRESK
ncbi:SrfA family protein [Yersinia ruckeri]|uniref:SrfA family protein n=1 Tax=Yersinia ruckeri TaxID=29486 RepID=UPI0005EA86DA|nr:SrfA family protein [Yersinia ruckeri]AKA37248.1 SrfA [Yersinia ruckeri]MCW6651958.1 SrfA family protein [Yersinia ruckeri]